MNLLLLTLLLYYFSPMTVFSLMTEPLKPGQILEQTDLET